MFRVVLRRLHNTRPSTVCGQYCEPIVVMIMAVHHNASP